MSNATHKTVLIAEHGSWNREKYIGYRVVKVVLDAVTDEVLSHSVFVDGFMNHDKQLFGGRPIHFTELNDGSILLSDDEADTVYRIYKDGGADKTVTQKLIGGHAEKINNWMASYERAG